jgi:hypothetical protein
MKNVKRTLSGNLILGPITLVQGYGARRAAARPSIFGACCARVSRIESTYVMVVVWWWPLMFRNSILTF